MRPARAYGETDVYKRQVQDALTDIVVADGGLDGLFGQDGAVHLVQGKACLLYTSLRDALRHAGAAAD